MMNKEDLFLIWDRFDASDAAELMYETSEGKILLKKHGCPADDGAAESRGLKEASAAGRFHARKEHAEEANAANSGRPVKAPLVGTFYRASAPGEKPFVRVGQSVKKGETLGIIEAMKMMNEITAPCDGVIGAILVEDETLVQFDQCLMTIGEENV